jgi:hypothetical protein
MLLYLVSNVRLLITNYQLPITNYQLPISDLPRSELRLAYILTYLYHPISIHYHPIMTAPSRPNGGQNTHLDDSTHIVRLKVRCIIYRALHINQEPEEHPITDPICHMLWSNPSESVPNLGVSCVRQAIPIHVIYREAHLYHHHSCHMS